MHRTSVLRERVAFWWTTCENASLSAHRDYDVAEVRDTGARSILSGCFAKLAQLSSLGPYLARDLAQRKGLVWTSLVFPFWTYGFLGSHGCWELVVTDRETTWNKHCFPPETRWLRRPHCCMSTFAIKEIKPALQPGLLDLFVWGHASFSGYSNWRPDVPKQSKNHVVLGGRLRWPAGNTHELVF